MIYSLEFYIYFTDSIYPLTHLEFMLFSMSNFCHLDSITKSLVLQVVGGDIIYHIFLVIFHAA